MFFLLLEASVVVCCSKTLLSECIFPEITEKSPFQSTSNYMKVSNPVSLLIDDDDDDGGPISASTVAVA